MAEGHPSGPMTQPAAWGLGLPSAGLDCHLCPLLRWPVAATLRRFWQKPRIYSKSLLVSLLPANESSPEALLLFLKAWVKWPCTQTSQAPLRRGQASSPAGLRGNVIRRGSDHRHLVVRCQGRRVGHKPSTAELLLKVEATSMKSLYSAFTSKE